MKKVVHVAVGVIKSLDGRILVAKRPKHTHMGGLWEFPGGKVEVGETLEEALSRELVEEVGIGFEHCQPLIQITHAYSDKTVLLDTLVVSGLTGQAHGREGQAIQWVMPDELNTLSFPEANKAIITAAQLPEHYMITGQFSRLEELLDNVSHQLARGIRLVQFRAPWLSEQEYLHSAQQLQERVTDLGGKLLVKGGKSMLAQPWCQGIHLRASQLYESRCWSDFRRQGQLLAASCHNEQELALAADHDVDFVTLSPVKHTKTHPEKEPLGMQQARRLTRVSSRPVYWLGGLDQTDREAARSSGAQGVAAIGAYWPPH